MLFSAATLFFPVLCVVTVAVGIRSYFAADNFFYSRIEAAPHGFDGFKGT